MVAPHKMIEPRRYDAGTVMMQNKAITAKVLVLPVYSHTHLPALPRPLECSLYQPYHLTSFSLKT